MLLFVLNVKDKKNKVRVGAILVFILTMVGDILLARNLDVYRNKGISFGVYFPGINILTIVVWLIVLVKVLVRFDWGLWLVVVGGGVNLGQKLIYGYVADYFKMFGVYNNLADLVIFIGIIWYILGDGKHRYSLQ